MQKNNKGFAKLFVVMLAVVFGALAVYFLVGRNVSPVVENIAPTVTLPTNDVKGEYGVGIQKYVNSKYGFEFEYPSVWGFLDSSSDKNIKLDPWVLSSYQFCENVVPASTLDNGQKTNEYCNNPNMVMQVWGGSQTDSVLSIGVQDTREEAIISGIKGVKISGKAQGVDAIQSIFFVKNNNYSYVFFPASWQIKNPGDKTIAQIIATFKFTK